MDIADDLREAWRMLEQIDRQIQTDGARLFQDEHDFEYRNKELFKLENQYEASIESVSQTIKTLIGASVYAAGLASRRWRKPKLIVGRAVITGVAFPRSGHMYRLGIKIQAGVRRYVIPLHNLIKLEIIKPAASR